MEVIIILILIFLNGLFSLSEIAIIYARKSSLKNDVFNGSKSAKTALDLSNNPDKFLSTIQIGITLIGIMTGIYSGDVIAISFGKWLETIGVSDSFSHAISQTIIVIIVTYLSIIFGELVPKRVGMSIPLKMAKLIAPLMNLISKIAFPFVWLLSKSTNFIFNLLKIKAPSEKITEEEIKSMIDEGTANGEVQVVEQEIVDRVFSLGDRSIQTIMTFKSEVETLDIDMTKLEVYERVSKNFHQVYPITKDRSYDNIIGVVHLKDLFEKFHKDSDFTIASCIKKAVFFHENANVYKVIDQIKRHHTNYGIITDEFGTMQGIITIKDILESLIGTIPENNEEEAIIKKGNNLWLVSGTCFFYDFLEYFNMDDLYSNFTYNTVSGFIFAQLKHIPIKNEKFEWHGLLFEIERIDGAKIKKLLVKKIAEKIKDKS